MYVTSLDINIDSVLCIPLDPFLTGLHLLACTSLLTYKIDAAKCKGCTLCARTCPVDAIIGKVKEAHIIDTNKCIKCGTCIDKCKFGAISRG